MAFHPSELKDERRGSSEAGLLSTAGKLHPAASVAVLCAASPHHRPVQIILGQEWYPWPGVQGTIKHYQPALGRGDAFAKLSTLKWLSVAVLVSAKAGSLPCCEELPPPTGSF